MINELGINSCAICLEPIKQPICERCHIKEVAYWLRDRGLSNFMQRLVVDELEARFGKSQINAGYCISCNNEVPNLCSFCFFYETAKLMKRFGLTEEDMENFMETFNYRQYDEQYVI